MQLHSEVPKCGIHSVHSVTVDSFLSLVLENSVLFPLQKCLFFLLFPFGAPNRCIWIFSFYLSYCLTFLSYFLFVSLCCILEVFFHSIFHFTDTLKLCLICSLTHSLSQYEYLFLTHTIFIFKIPIQFSFTFVWYFKYIILLFAHLIISHFILKNSSLFCIL